MVNVLNNGSKDINFAIELKSQWIIFTVNSHIRCDTIRYDRYTHYLREQAKQSIKEYTTKYLPEQYQVFDIIDTSDDNREKLHAMELFKDTQLVKLELLSNATTIDSALHYIRNKQQQREQQKKLASDLAIDDNNDQLTTTDGRQTIF